MDRKTVRKYVAAAEAAGITPGGPALSHEQWSALARQWFPELLTPQLRCPSFSELARFHETIKTGLGVNTASTVWQRLRDEDGLQASLASFRRYIHAELPEEAARSAVTVRKDDPPPGQEAQIDYGFLGTWTDPASSRRRRVWAFVMVLAACRHMFAPPRAGDAVGRLDRGARRGVRVLRRRPGPARARQPQNGGDQTRPVRPESSTAPTRSWPPITAP